MPTNFSALDQNLPRFTGEESVERKVQVIQDYRPFEEEEDTMTGKEIYEALQEYTAKLPLPDWARASVWPSAGRSWRRPNAWASPTARTPCRRFPGTRPRSWQSGR